MFNGLRLRRPLRYLWLKFKGAQRQALCLSITCSLLLVWAFLALRDNASAGALGQKALAGPNLRRASQPLSQEIPIRAPLHAADIASNTTTPPPNHLLPNIANHIVHAEEAADPPVAPPVEEPRPAHEAHSLEFPIEALPLEGQRAEMKPPARSKAKAKTKPSRQKLDAAAMAKRDQAELKWNYLSAEKFTAYEPHPEWRGKLDVNSRLYYNALAVFPEADSSRHMHGKLGLYQNGSAVWQPGPKPPPIDQHKGGAGAAIKKGGFYQELSDALPLDRLVPDHREAVCKAETYDIPSLPDTSIVITFYNEPISLLLRTVFSVLNYSPAPLVREIILVDDHSDLDSNAPGGPLYDHIQSLPKVKLMRLAERKGIVQARIAGAKTAKGEVLIILDSHIEVAPGWLEPQLARIRESPKSVVFPQILSLTHDTFVHKPQSGIGCFLDFRWSIVEHATLTGQVTSAKVQASPSMAGGLLAVNLDWFWELGGYDEDFVAWGAENVEMGFRVWQCGGRVECAPCARTYHVFRKGGAGYSNPTGALWRNRRRTAHIWMDEYADLSRQLVDVSAVHTPDENYGPVDKMLRLRERLHCKPFKWYLQNVTPDHDIQELSDILGLGRISFPRNNKCIDLQGARAAGTAIGVYTCHPEKKISANQGFLVSREDSGRIRLMTNDKRCVAFIEKSGSQGGHLQVEQCTDQRSQVWEFRAISPSEPREFYLIHNGSDSKQLLEDARCLIAEDRKALLGQCEPGNEWRITPYVSGA